MGSLDLALGGVLQSGSDGEFSVVEGFDKVEIPSRLEDSAWNLFLSGMFGTKQVLGFITFIEFI